jgi:hypothetical protein
VPRIYLFLLGITGVFTACKGSAGPDALASSFVDAYYIEYDFDRALTYADGAAKERLLEEKKLVDAARQKTELAQARTHVYYGAPRKHAVGDDLVHYTFELEIHQGSTDLERTAVVMTARQGGAWKVIAFREEGPKGAEANSGEDQTNGVRTSSRGKARDRPTTGTAAPGVR